MTTEGVTAASLAEEIRLLVEMVAERAAPWLDGVVAAGHGKPETPEGDGDCGWCPLCAIVAVVRGEKPEFVARVLEQAAQIIALLRAVLADRWEPQEGVHMPGFQPPPRPRPESGRVQRIPVQWRDG
ncbi:hypothetical protein L1857_27475 [Amycolatopsis thermalba]|uniref:Uncharacterized protein n=1 Tax=Amycolatopsis thermalba TaxID=944492 RepID=A0ABY4P1R1_9PSEU|nr:MULTISPECIES: hypothetical protein [Amycolatopsis]OXM66564.1 hypothetical protein CF166_26305 [Amycolatopsis sp. KNN50.9b]UQS26287.1 hypothetical protein L1857_27475 [Amycolatopsis thermalba]